MNMIGGSLGSVAAIAAGLLGGEKVQNLIAARVGGEGPPTATVAMGIPAAVGVAGYMLGRRGGVVGKLGQGLQVGALLHLAGRFLGGFDRDFGS